MSSNDITGDALRTKAPSKAYDAGYDRIFGGKKNNRDFLLEFSGLDNDVDRWKWVLSNMGETSLTIGFSEYEEEETENLFLIFSDIIDDLGYPEYREFDTVLPSYVCAIDLFNALGLPTTYD